MTRARQVRAQRGTSGRGGATRGESSLHRVICIRALAHRACIQGENVFLTYSFIGMSAIRRPKKKHILSGDKKNMPKKETQHQIKPLNLQQPLESDLWNYLVNLDLILASYCPGGFW